MLIFEDVHWADNATLDLVKYLGRRLPAAHHAGSQPAQRRDRRRPSLAHVLGDLPAGGDPHHAWSAVAGAVMALAEQTGRSGADLYRITAGNPFFVTELLASGDAEPSRCRTPSATRSGRGCRG